MINTINNQRIYQYNPSISHIITDSEETMKLLEKKCGFVKPWSMEDKPDTQDKNKQEPVKQEFKKIDYLF